MRTIGLLGGMSWESTELYYRLINEQTKRVLGGLHSAPIAMVSVDFHEIEQLQEQGDWDAAATLLSEKARRVESIIRTMLMAKGRPFGEVKHEAKNIGGSGQQLSFLIDDGPRAKIQKIEFDGNEVFTDGQLRGVLKKLKPAGLTNLSWLGGI